MRRSRLWSRLHDERGFTLIELLGVTAILGIISVVATVSIGGFLDSSKTAGCSADAKAISTAEDTAYAANSAYLSEQGLVDGNYMHSLSSTYDVVLDGSGQYSLQGTGDCVNVPAVGIGGVSAGELAYFTMSVPSSATAGSSFSATVTAKDGANNTLTSYAGSVQFSTSDPNSPSVPSSYTFTSGDGGVRSVPGFVLKTAGTQTLNVISTGLSAKSGTTSVSVVAGGATQLVFTQQPTDVDAGSPITPVVGVQVEDAYGNLAGSTADIAMAIGTNPGGATLSGTTTQTAVSGLATFADLALAKPGTGYTLVASSSGLTSATSSPFDVQQAAGSKVVLTTQPTTNQNIVAGAPTSFVASVEDALGNVVTADDTTEVSLALSTNPGGGTFSCTNPGGTGPVTVTAGVATFTCTIDKVGAGYKVTTSNSASLTDATSNRFNIVAGTASKLAFTTQPGGGNAATAWGQQPVVTIQDASGNTVTSSNASVALGIATNPGGGTLTCTANPKNAAAGVDTFAGCRIDKSGSGYTLTASASGLASATSNSFDIAAGAGTKVVFTTEPSTSSVHSPMTIVASVEDAGGNVVTTNNSTTVTLSFASNPGASTLSCTNPGGAGPVTVTAGAATFTCSLDKVATGYTLKTANSSSLTNDTSAAFDITAGAPAKLVFSTQPGGGAGGTAWATQPVVKVQDAFGNTVTTDTSAVTLAIGTNPGGGALTCTANPKNAVAGVATFAGCKIDKSGTGYTLVATDGALTSATSSAFNITGGTASKLVITTSPLSGTAANSATLGPLTIQRQDAAGNPVTAGSTTVTLASSSAGDKFAATSGGSAITTTTITAGNSTVSVFYGDTVAGTPTITASASGLTSATQTATITVGPAAKLVFSTQPGGGTAGSAWATQPVVKVQDALGNTVTTDSSSVTLAIGTNPGGGTLAGTTTVAAVNGVATFSGLSIEDAGTGYTLVATDGALTSATSSAFTITAGPASKLVITTSPLSGTASSSATLGPITIQRQDALGNPVTTGTTTVNLSSSSSGDRFAATSGGGAITTRSIAAGSSTANVFYGDRVAGTPTITVSATGLTSATQTATISPGSASKLIFTSTSKSCASGSVAVGNGGTWTSKVSVADALGNVVVGASSRTVTLSNNRSNALLSPLSLTVPSGASETSGSFSQSRGNNNTTYTVRAASSGLTSATCIVKK